MDRNYADFVRRRLRKEDFFPPQPGGGVNGFPFSDPGPSTSMSMGTDYLQDLITLPSLPSNHHRSAYPIMSVGVPVRTENNAPTQTFSPLSPAAVDASRRQSAPKLLSPAPTPTLTPLNTKIPLATAIPKSLDSQGSPAGAGPTSASYVVPPRPKPGRKPATDEPASKRKAQNRESQRAFRARKAAKLTEMQVQVEDAEQRHQREITAKHIELNEKNMEISQLRVALTEESAKLQSMTRERDHYKKEAVAWKNGLERLTDQLNAAEEHRRQGRHDSGVLDIGTPQSYTKVDITCGDCRPGGECACVEEMAKLPNDNVYMAAVPLPAREPASPLKHTRPQMPHSNEPNVYEIDFTARFAKPSNQPSISFMTQSNDQDTDCGFCTDDANCLCKAEGQKALDGIGGGASLDTSPTQIKPMSGNRGTGPGSCDACMTNPQQRAWCQRVAQLRASGNENHVAPPSSRSSRNSSFSSEVDPLDPRKRPSVGEIRRPSSIGCSDAYKLLEGRVSMDDDHMDWVSKLRPVSPSKAHRQLPDPRKYSAMELETAGVIATLQHSMVPLVARQSDGANADIVSIARQKQRETESPRENGTTGYARSRASSASPALPISTLINGNNNDRRPPRY